MEARITLITLGVSDLARSVQFYRDGLRPPKRDGAEGIAFFETAGTWRSLYPRDSLAAAATVSSQGSGFRGFSLAHNVASPEEVDRVLQEAVDAGATLVKPGQKVFWGGYSGYCSDPDGVLWEAAWNPHSHRGVAEVPPNRRERGEVRCRNSSSINFPGRGAFRRSARSV